MVSYAKQREMGIYQSLYISADCRQGEIIFIHLLLALQTPRCDEHSGSPGPAARRRPSAAPVNSTHTCAPSVGERSPLGKEIGPVVVVVVVEVLVEGVDGRRLGLQENLELGQRVEVDVGE